MASPKLPEGTLPDHLDSTARLQIAHDSNAFTAARRQLNLIGGTNVTVTLADDNVNEKVNATLAVASAAPSGTAGGDLTGTYPNPTIRAGAVTRLDIQNGVELVGVYLLGGM